MVTDLRAIELPADLGWGHGAACTPTPCLAPHRGAGPASRITDWRGFHTDLQSAAIVATQTGAPLSLLMLEAFGSDQANQPHGSGIAAEGMDTLACAVRAVVGECGRIARYGEGRLAVILIDTGLDDAVRRAERIAYRVSSLCSATIDGVDLDATAAIGVAQFQDDESLSHLIQRTADALEQARTRQGPTVVADHATRKRPARLPGHFRMA